jgi:hypothetical protein
VNGSAAFDAQTRTITFVPTAGYVGQAGFGYTISDGQGGTAGATATLNVIEPTATVSLFCATSAPSMVAVNDPTPVELGVKFQASTNGDITGIRFYKSALYFGTHTADLWTASGTLLATATFTNETAGGWQQVDFATPVSIASGTTYIASYHTSGNYSADPVLFANSAANGLLPARQPAAMASMHTGPIRSSHPTPTIPQVTAWTCSSGPSWRLKAAQFTRYRPQMVGGSLLSDLSSERYSEVPSSEMLRSRPKRQRDFVEHFFIRRILIAGRSGRQRGRIRSGECARIKLRGRCQSASCVDIVAPRG